MKKFAIWTAVVVAVVMLIIGLCFGKVVEETLFLEIAKWVLMTIGIICIFEVFAYTLGQLAYDSSSGPRTGTTNEAGVMGEARRPPAHRDVRPDRRGRRPPSPLVGCGTDRMPRRRRQGGLGHQARSRHLARRDLRPDRGLYRNNYHTAVKWN